MRIRIALLSGFLALAAGAAAAIPTATVPTNQTTGPTFPWPCEDTPVYFIVDPWGPTTGPWDPTACIPSPWPF